VGAALAALEKERGSGGRGGEQQGGGSIICGGYGPVQLICLLVFWSTVEHGEIVCFNRMCVADW